jgi:hypothetical protein
VKKLGPLKIVHEKYKAAGKNDDAAREFHSEFDDAVKYPFSCVVIYGRYL